MPLTDSKANARRSPMSIVCAVFCAFSQVINEVMLHSRSLRCLHAIVFAIAFGGLSTECNAQDKGDSLRSTAPVDTTSSMRLRFVWGGASVADYSGTIEIDSGDMHCLRRLNVDEFEPGFVISQDPKRIPIRDLNTRFSGMDVDVRGDSKTRIRVRIHVRSEKIPQGATKELEWSLGEIRDQSAVVALDESGNRFSVDRVPGDRIRVLTDRPHLIYNADEPFGIRFAAHETAYRNTALALDATLVRASDGTTIKQSSKTITTSEFGTSIAHDFGISNVPRDEGVYELHIALTPKRMMPGLLGRPAGIKRVVQFVVFNDKDQRYTDSMAYQDDIVHDDEWIRVGSVSLDNVWKSTAREELTRLLEPAKSARFPRMKRPLQWLSELSGTNSANRTVLMTEPSPDNAIEGYLSPGDRCGFEVGPLSVDRLHRIRLDVGFQAANVQMRIGNPGTEHDGHSSAIDGLGQQIESESRWLETVQGDGSHSLEMLFWASGLKHSVSVQNLHPSNELLVRGIAVEMWNPATRISEFERHASSTNHLSTILELHRTNVSRWFGSSLANPVVHNGEIAEPKYDDWSLFLRATTRLAEYCVVNGYNTVRMPVTNAGAGLYPSAQFMPNPRFDTGCFSADGRDPMQKDVVELLYRVLGRHGVRFEPLLEVSSPIYSLESIRYTSGDGDLMQRASDAAATTDLESSRYNPLSDRFQFEFAKIVGEFKSRYGAKSNYAGIGCVIDEQSHLSLNAPVETLHESILDKFAAATPATMPRERTERQRFISTHATASFYDWAREDITRWLNKELDRTVQWRESDNTNDSGLGALIARSLRDWELDGPKSVLCSYESPSLETQSNERHFRSLVCRLDAGAMRRFPINRGAGAGEIDFWVPDLRATNRIEASGLVGKPGKQFILSNENQFGEIVQIQWDMQPDITQFASSHHDSERRWSQDELVQVDAANKAWLVKMPPMSVVAFRVNSLTAMPIAASVQASKTGQAIDGALTHFEQGINRLSVPQPIRGALVNSGFDEPLDARKSGSFAGWTTSIAPSVNVHVDTEFAADGKQSLLMEFRNGDYGGWIQSEPFTIPECQRLTLKMKSAANQIPDSVVVSLWMYNKSTKAFEVISRQEIAERYRGNQFATGQWNEILVDFSSEIYRLYSNEPLPVYRLQLDVRGSGKVWFDAMQLSNAFLYEAERRDLRSQLFVSRRAVQAGDFGPANALLGSSWNYLGEWSDDLMMRTTDSQSDRASEAVARTASESQSQKTATDPNNAAKKKKGFWWFRRTDTQR